MYFQALTLQGYFDVDTLVIAVEANSQLIEDYAFSVVSKLT